MESPFPKSSSRPGKGRIVAKLLPNGGTGLERVSFRYPLKLISPRPAPHHRSAGAFILSYGGGLVGGDQVDLAVDVLQGARLNLVTQGHTKIFKSAAPDVVTRQRLTVTVNDGAALCLLPDPVQPFKDSVYEQDQVFTVAGTGSVCLLDWVTEGRTARGESWSFWRWQGCNELWQMAEGGKGDGETARSRLLVRDTVKLVSGDPLLSGKQLNEIMHGHGVFGTLILRGPVVSSLGEFFLAEFAELPRLGARGFKSIKDDKASEGGDGTGLESWRARRLVLEREEKVLWCAASVRGCTVVKFGAATVEGGRRWIGNMLIREGSISKVFGAEALFCVK